MGKYFFTALLAFVPVSEVRGAIPYGFFNNIPLWQVLIIAVLCNMMVPLIGYLFLNTLHGILMKWSYYNRMVSPLLDRARSKINAKIEKYGILGLTLFVAIPLPITGAWTGVLGAWVLSLEKKKSILAIMLGVLIASAIVTTVILTGSGLAQIFTKNF